MPYTAAQLNGYYQQLTGVAPDASTTLLFQAYANQDAAGTLSDAATLAGVFNSVGVQNTFEVAESTYQFFTGATTSAAGLQYLEGSGNANGLTTAYYNGTNGSISAPSTTNGFNTENRYYNFAINLTSSAGPAQSSFSAAYGSLTFAQTVAAAYENIVGSANVGTAQANAAVADITSRMAYFQQVAATRGGDSTALTNPNASLTLKAVVVGYILEEANKADVGTYAKAIDQFEASVAAGNAIYNTNLLQTYVQGGAGYNTGVGVSGSGVATGTTIAFTAGTDNFNTTAGNVTFVGQVGGAAAGTAGTSPTLGPADTVNAGGSNNTLLVTAVVTGGTAIADASGGALLNGIQTIDVRAVNGDGSAASTVTLAQGTVASATTLNNYLSNGESVVFTNVGGATTVGVVGNGSVGNSNTTANFVSGTTANINLTGGLITTNGASSGAGNVTVGTTGTSTTAAGTVNIASTAGPNRIGTLALTSANTTALNISAAVSYRDGTLTNAGGDLTTITATGAGTVNVGNATGVTTLTTVNAQSSGGFTGSFTTAASGTSPFSIVTGAGRDNITIDNATASTSVNTSGGGDTITVTGTVTAGTSLNGGGGATLGVTAAQYAAISGGAFGSAMTNAANTALITGFSTVALNTQLTAGTTYDVNAIGAQNFRTIGVAGAGAATVNVASVTQVAAGPTVTFSDTTTANTGSGNGGTYGTLTVNEVNAATSTNDILNLNFSLGTQNANSANVVAQGVEKLNIAVNPNAITGAGTEVLTLGITDYVAQSINFTGADSFNFTAANSFAQLKTVNASAETGNATIDVSAINTASSASPLTVTTGAGNDVVTVRDFTLVNTGGTTATSGLTAGFDTVNVNTTTSGQTYSSIQNAVAGLHINMQGATSINTTQGSLASTAVFQDYLDNSVARTGTGQESYFQFGGNTYIVEHNSNGATTFQNGVDSVVQLVGLHTISTASTGGTIILGS